MPPHMPYAPLVPWCLYPHPQYMDLVVKIGTTAGQHGMSSACGSGWCYVRCTPIPAFPYAPSVPPGRGICWPRVVLTWVPLTWAHVLLSAIDHLEFSRVLCNRPSSFSYVTPMALTSPYAPCQPPWCPTYPTLSTGISCQIGTTAGQHNMSSACGSGWWFVRCAPTPSLLMPPQCPR